MASTGDDLYAIRDRLDLKTWTYSHNGRATDVTVSYHCWPEVTVIIHSRGSGFRAAGVFAPNGRLRSVAFDAIHDQAEITTAVLRQLPAVRVLKSWEVVGREVARQILAGVPEDEIVIDGIGPTEALRMLVSAADRTPATRRRGAQREDLIRQVAEAYREAVDSGDPKPRATLAARFGYSGAHVGRLLVDARRTRDGQQALLGPALRGRAGEAQGAGDGAGRGAPDPGGAC
jgi:hypothetical protein